MYSMICIFFAEVYGSRSVRSEFKSAKQLIQDDKRLQPKI